jgi:hypothetical protein
MGISRMDYLVEDQERDDEEEEERRVDQKQYLVKWS